MPGHGLPPVALILLNWNGWQNTIACLESIAALTYPDADFVLCDNASSDDSVDRIAEWARNRGWQTRVVLQSADLGAQRYVDTEPRLAIVRSSENLGFAGGNNLAIRYALASGRRYRYMWVLNTDTTVDRDALTCAVRTLETGGGVAAVQSVLVWTRDARLIDSAGIQLRWRGGGVDLLHHAPRHVLDRQFGMRSAIEIFGCCAAAALFRADALKDAGMFDEAFFLGHEDVDLACRLRQRGHRAVLASGSVVYHLGGGSREVRKQGLTWWRAHRNKLLVVARWYPRLLGAPILAFGAVRAFVAALGTSEVSLGSWLGLLRLLWREWRGGASRDVRRTILRLGTAGFVES
jgi:GT2 family glycosyltransferase